MYIQNTTGRYITLLENSSVGTEQQRKLQRYHLCEGKRQRKLCENRDGHKLKFMTNFGCFVITKLKFNMSSHKLLAMSMTVCEWRHTGTIKLFTKLQGNKREEFSLLGNTKKSIPNLNGHCRMLITEFPFCSMGSEAIFVSSAPSLFLLAGGESRERPVRINFAFCL